MQAEPDPPLILEFEEPEEQMPKPVRVMHPDGYVTEEGEFHE